MVPNAESGATPTPKTGVEMVTFAAPTANPIDPVTAAVPTCAFAVIVVAPAVAPPVSVIVATPTALVSAVPEGGIIVAIVDAVLNVTMVNATGAPAAFLKVAFTVAEVPLETEFTVVPIESVSAITKLGAPTGTVPPPPVVVVVPPAAVPPSPQAESRANADADKSTANNLWIFLL